MNTIVMKYLISLIIIFIVTAGFSQTVADLEKELKQVQRGGYEQYFHKSKKWKPDSKRQKDYDNAICTYSNKIISICNKILLIDKYNEHALTMKYFETNCLSFCQGLEIEQTDNPAIDAKVNRDTTLLLFDRLIAADSLNPVPYILKAEIPYSDGKIKRPERQALLKKALSLDSLNSEANYELGSDYYSDITGQKMDTMPADKLKDMAKKTFDLLSVVFHADTTHALELSYVLTQLATFLDYPADAYDPRLIHYKDTLYFPVLCFSGMPDDWKTNMKVNIIYHFGIDEFTNNWFSEQLSAMQEPVIKDVRNSEIYRFTWLRTFHKPVAIRIYKEGNKATIVWKSCNGAGGYSPGQLNASRSKKLSEKEWQKFREMLLTLDYWNMPTNKETFGCDGAEWILEGVSGNHYHVVDRWSPSDDYYAQTCLYLLSLTNLRIKKEEIYIEKIFMGY